MKQEKTVTEMAEAFEVSRAAIIKTIISHKGKSNIISFPFRGKKYAARKSGNQYLIIAL